MKTVDGNRTEYHYDLASRLTGAVTPDNVLEFTYDTAGRLVSQAVDGAILRFTHDRAGRRRSRTTPAEAVTAWAHGRDDGSARMTVSWHTIDFSYDAAGREVACRFGQFATLTSAYGPSGRLVGQVVTGAPTRA
ncbi:hypothetical protein [Streptomyces sp. M2CJ-2]|uniref:hypothetical protein n=1 Tax=Streptomyces sp. M2CJ-2 TaxID=2803948 RepID=UPI0027DC740C|nr:hypothetical protein [Streptomyces sp. M2CJ-2]